MNRRKTVVAREEKGFEYEIPSYLKTSWTSNDNSKFCDICKSLQEAFPQGQPLHEPDGPKTLILGFKEVFRQLKRDAMSIMCVVACIDNGLDAGVTSRLARDCFSNGVPLVLGRGPRELGAVFGKQRVSCVALTRYAASRSGLLDFIMNMSAITSTVSVPLDEPSELDDRYLACCESISGNLKRPLPPVTKSPAVPPPANAAKKQKNNNKPKSGAKKGNFFASFD